MEKMCKAVHAESASLFDRQEWDNLVTTSCQIAESKDPMSLGVLNQGICQYLNLTGQYEMPVVKSINCPAPKEMVALYHIGRWKEKGCVPHFYAADGRFENTWKHPVKVLETLANYPMTVSPDFSVYENLALPQKLWNIFRNKLLAAWWQYNGIKVIPNVSWIYGKDYTMSFDGWPRHSVIAVNSTGINGVERCKKMWLEGYQVMLETLNPTHILRYGGYIEGECENISTYYDNDNKKLVKHGW